MKLLPDDLAFRVLFDRNGYFIQLATILYPRMWYRDTYIPSRGRFNPDGT